MNALQQNELLEIDEIESQEQTQFEITDLDSLNWAFRKLSALKSKEKEIKQLANVERDRIAQWEQSELSTIENSTSFFEGLIQQYHSQKLAEDPKVKTISTPYGKSKTRKSKEAPEKANEDELLEYVLENEMLDFIKNSVKWSDLKKTLKIVEISGEKVVVDENGQLVKGVTVKPESISYSVEV
nr:host-nuclease inhibitor Gam family protein [Heyndrickxia oleronia]